MTDATALIPAPTRSHRVLLRPACEIPRWDGQPCRARVPVGQTRCVHHRRFPKEAAVGTPVRGLMVKNEDGKGVTIRLEVG